MARMAGGSMNAFTSTETKGAKMKRRMRVLAGAVVLVWAAGCARNESGSGAGSGAGAGSGQAGVASPFEKAHVQFEQNATDGDLEAVFEAIGGAEGLKALTVTAPDGRTVVDFSARDGAAMGMRSFRFESPEPNDIATLAAAYPEGAYTFKGITGTGAALEGSATLHHGLPATTTFVRPAAGAENVTMNHLVLAWTPVPNVAGYIVTIEQDELKVSVEAHLPGSASTFVVPDGFLAPGTEYTMGIGTVTEDGNASYIEGTFTTAKKE